MNGAISPDEIELYRKEFASNPLNRLAQNAVTHVGLDDVAIDREIIIQTSHVPSILLDDWKVTNQERSGRCWLFAGLNLLRVGAMVKMGLKDFEFSQNYVMFWDKFERANYFLEAMIATSERDLDDRTVAFLLDGVANDGGQWNMFVAIVEKHGLLPKTVMPETNSSSNTGRMNAVLRMVLREGARSVRAASGNGIEPARAEKSKILDVVYRILCIHLGTPPECVDWQWTDKERQFHRDGPLTAREFASRYVTVPIEDYVCLVNDPRPTSPFGRTFTVEYLGNVVDGAPVRYLNVDIEVLKNVARRTLEGGEPVWFGCDVNKMISSEYAIWDAKLYDLPSVYDTSFSLTKGDRLELHETRMTHAMLFTGVDVVDGSARRWRVENSWGTDKGRDGFYTMNDSWFDEYVFEIAARRELIPGSILEALDAEPIVLPAWDPMGSLAGGR